MKPAIASSGLSWARDYVGKPFDPRELMARMEGGAATANGAVGAAPERMRRVRFGPFEFDRATRQLRHRAARSADERELHGSMRSSSMPTSASCERLLERTQASDNEHSTRRSSAGLPNAELIEDDPAHPRVIQDVWGVGYVRAGGGRRAAGRAAPR